MFSYLTSSDIPGDHEAWILEINFIDEETYLLEVTSLVSFIHVIAESLSFQLPCVCESDHNFWSFKT